MKRYINNSDKSNFKRQNSNDIDKVKEILPIVAFRKQLIDSIHKHATTIVIGETGSGKSTQLPQYILEARISNSKCIVCTQPRRVAAVTISQRVALERNSVIGNEVGYSIRFEDKSTASTRLKYVTDGVLLREIVNNPKLSNYGVIILDEAHERSLQTDILMGLLRQLQKERQDLKVVVMSATLQVELFMNFFQDTSLVSIPGRQFPVDIYYLKEPEADYVDATMLACLQLHADEDDGDVLVFLPGQDDIESLQVLLEQNLPSVQRKCIRNVGTTLTNDFEVRSLYAALPPDEQMKVFQPTREGVRKFIVATNIAETSVTITGIKYVIDSGYAKTRSIQQTTGMEMLKIMPISQSQANQRAGRAGRESPGKCFRLFTESAFEELIESTTPEIQRVNISQIILQLKMYGIKSLDDFPFLSPPSFHGLRNSLEELLLIGALDKSQNLTDHGFKLASLPVDPQYGNLLLKSVEFNCESEILTAVSMLSSDKIFLQPHREDQKQAAHQAHSRFASPDGDLLTLVSIYQAWINTKQDSKWATQNFLSQRSLSHAHNIRQQLTQIMSKMDIDTSRSSLPSKVPFLKCVAAGLCLNIAKRTSTIDLNSRHQQSRDRNQYKASNHFAMHRNSMSVDQSISPYTTLRGGQGVHIHPSSILFKSKKLPDYVAFSELLITSKHYMRNVTAVDISCLSVVAPQIIKGIFYETSHSKAI